MPRPVFALLAWPELWHARRHEVAHAAGVSLGQAHNALALLAEVEYSNDETRPGQTPLLELWASAFPTGLAAKLTLASFHGDVDEPKMVTADDVDLPSFGSVEDPEAFVPPGRSVVGSRRRPAGPNRHGQSRRVGC